MIVTVCQATAHLRFRHRPNFSMTSHGRISSQHAFANQKNGSMRTSGWTRWTPPRSVEERSEGCTLEFQLHSGCWLLVIRCYTELNSWSTRWPWSGLHHVPDPGYRFAFLFLLMMIGCLSSLSRLPPLCSLTMRFLLKWYWLLRSKTIHCLCFWISPSSNFLPTGLTASNARSIAPLASPVETLCSTSVTPLSRRSPAVKSPPCRVNLENSIW